MNIPQFVAGLILTICGVCLSVMAAKPPAPKKENYLLQEDFKAGDSPTPPDGWKATAGTWKFKREPEPADGAFRLVQMSNGLYAVENYYRGGFWHPVGGGTDYYTDFETAKKLFDVLNRKAEQKPTVEKIIQ